MSYTAEQQIEIDPAHFVAEIARLMGTLSNNYFRAAADSWKFPYIMENDFIDPGLKAPPHVGVSSEDTKTRADIDLHDAGHMAGEYLDILNGMEDLKACWTYLKALMAEESALILGDDFMNVEDDDLSVALAASVSGPGLNVVIMGAGCVGLCVAQGLKRAMGDGVNVLVIENRVHAKHIKKPYERNWLTSLSQKLTTFLDERVQEFFVKISEGGNSGPPINVLETLLLLAAKDLGVKFYYDDDYDLSFIEQSKTHLIFDATGRRIDVSVLDSRPKLTLAPETAINIEVGPEKDYGAQYEQFGLTNYGRDEVYNISLKQRDGVYYPFVEGEQIKTAVVKITHVPHDYVEALKSSVREDNQDNKFMLWAGTLKPEINEFVTQINLHKPAFEALTVLTRPMSLQKFMDDYGADIEALDPRLISYIRQMQSLGVDMDTALIEPPFIFAPYTHHMAGELNTQYGCPVIPIGDSVYNGSPKCGNGLGLHVYFALRIYNLTNRLYEEIQQRAVRAID